MGNHRVGAADLGGMGAGVVGDHGRPRGTPLRGMAWGGEGGRDGFPPPSSRGQALRGKNVLGAGMLVGRGRRAYGDGGGGLGGWLGSGFLGRFLRRSFSF